MPRQTTYYSNEGLSKVKNSMCKFYFQAIEAVEVVVAVLEVTLLMHVYMAIAKIIITAKNILCSYPVLCSCLPHRGLII